MNTYTKIEMFRQSAEFILNNSDLLRKNDCMIVNDVLYERCEKSVYRFFFDTDDYDYLENEELIQQLDAMFE